MNAPRDFEAALRKTLEDQRLSRSENKALRALVAETDPQSLHVLRNIAFRVAKGETEDDKRAEIVLDWLEDVIKALMPDQAMAKVPSTQVLFSPGDEPLRQIVGLLGGARKSSDICVFTITDDRISDAIIGAHERGVKVRVITDDDKSSDRGSDVQRLERAGVAVKMDGTPAHMHHKFALFDRSTLLNGSYNWTRSAANHNRENVTVSGDPRMVAPFAEMFDRLWDELG